MPIFILLEQLTHYIKFLRLNGIDFRKCAIIFQIYSVSLYSIFS